MCRGRIDASEEEKKDYSLEESRGSMVRNGAKGAW